MQILTACSGPECFHVKKIGLDRYPIGRRIEVEAKPILNATGRGALLLDLGKPGFTQAACERDTVVHPVMGLTGQTKSSDLQRTLAFGTKHQSQKAPP
jgi:hypothetical protein